MMAGSELSPEALNDWLARGRQGDEAACAAIFEHFSPAVLRLALGLLGDRQDAEEVVQDSFVYALRNLARFDPARSAFSTWLYTITLCRCRNKRRRKWLLTLPLDRLAAEAQGPGERQVEALLERRGVRADLWRALQTLPPYLREAVALRYLGEMRYREVGQALGCSPKTAESRVRQGVVNLRAALRAWGVEAHGDLAEQGV
ncbi:MAG: sigma-70 family RNA polymerase sigma factor [Anaerolineales bacterium]|nr:sigma-70 family RNA polymerase sigma factor [Anaerolineales bacterium]